MNKTAKDFFRRLSLQVVPPLYRVLTGLLFASCRVTEYGREHYDNLVDRGAPFIASFWHYSIFYTIYRIEGKRWVAMVSSSDDAEYVSQLLQRLGLDTVRGSRRKGGLSALKEMMKKIKKDGKRAALVADGSQGPALKVQAGCILLASKSGVPILPFVWGADRYWAFGSWDRTVLPKPFARLSVCFGEPLLIPARISSKELEGYRLLLERRLHDIYERVWGDFDIEEH